MRCLTCRSTLICIYCKCIYIVIISIPLVVTYTHHNWVVSQIALVSSIQRSVVNGLQPVNCNRLPCFGLPILLCCRSCAQHILCLLIRRNYVYNDTIEVCLNNLNVKCYNISIRVSLLNENYVNRIAKRLHIPIIRTFTPESLLTILNRDSCLT